MKIFRSIRISLEKKILGLTIGSLVLIAKVVVENKVLDALLLLLLGLLLGAHGNSEAGVRWQVDLTSLAASAMRSNEIENKGSQLTCCLFPRLLSRENFIIPGAFGGSASPCSSALAASRAFLIGRATSNIGFRSVCLD